jgi:hypothetical protein
MCWKDSGRIQGDMSHRRWNWYMFDREKGIAHRSWLGIKGSTLVEESGKATGAEGGSGEAFLAVVVTFQTNG